MITIKEVSELACVSQATVSRVLNGHPTVKDTNREKVFSAIEKLGYQPNAFAQALASSRSNSIGLLVGSLAGPFYGMLMYHVEEALRHYKMHLMVTSGQESYSREQEAIRFLQSKKADGLIIHSDTLSDDELIMLVQGSRNTIILNRYIPEISDHCLYIDNELGGYLATSYLLENGHTKIGCITGQLSKVDSRDRLQGYRNALTKAGIDYEQRFVIEGRFDLLGNDVIAKRLLDRAPELTAIFCQNDNIALAVYDEAIRRGMTLGKDLSVVGFDNDVYSQHIRPQLTTINFPLEKMAYEAVRAVNALINKKDYVLHSKLAPELVVRSSVEPVVQS